MPCSRNASRLDDEDGGVLVDAALPMEAITQYREEATRVSVVAVRPAKRVPRAAGDGVTRECNNVERRGAGACTAKSTVLARPSVPTASILPV